MHQGDTIRILMYSHDTYGLGHLTRTLRIARAIREHYPHASVLVLSGSPVAPYLALPPGSDLVKLPSVVKEGPDSYRSRDLEVSFPQIKRIRRELILGTAQAFRPHLLLVDNVPLGMKGEIVATLRYLRAESRETRIVLNLRDILDDPAVIRAHWLSQGVPETLREFYDRIFILGDPTVFDAMEAYGLPPSKAVHVGYAAPGPRPIDRPATDGLGPRVLVTVGGGGDGSEFLKAVLEGASRARRGEASRPRMEIVTGPLMSVAERISLGERAEEAGATIHEFVPDLPSRMSAADLVVAMAGYNTCCEILSHARAALLLPRVTPRVEQLLRAQAFERRGIARMLPPSDAHPEAIMAAVNEVLEWGPRTDESDLPEMHGLDRLAEGLGEICPSLRGPGTRITVPPPAPRATGPTPPSPPPRLERSASALSLRDQHVTPTWYWPGVALGTTRS